MDQVERSQEKTSAWRRVLEQTSGALMRQGRGSQPEEEPAGDEASEA
jgi:hypothetical protein